MIAEEVIQGVFERAEYDAYLHGAWNSRPTVEPSEIIDALTDAGFEVVKQVGLLLDGHSIPSWSLGSLIKVSAHQSKSYQSPVELKTMDGPPIFMTPAEAREFAGAVLAAADEAQATS